MNTGWMAKKSQHFARMPRQMPGGVPWASALDLEHVAWEAQQTWPGKPPKMLGKMVEKPWKSMENHAKPWKTMANHGK